MLKLIKDIIKTFYERDKKVFKGTKGEEIREC